MKSGKTSAACSFPRALLCAFESGYNAIGGVKAVDITKWSDFKLVLRQLDSDAARQMYDTVIIDTIPIAWDLNEQYICAQNGVQNVRDVPWGAGFTAAKKEFEQSLRKITQMGYGLVLIAHSSTRIEKAADGSDVEIIGPELPKRAAEICNGLVDIIGYIGNEYNQETKEYKRWLYTRETPTLFAGSRFKHLKPKIPFGYNELVDAIVEAIEKSEKIDGAQIVDKLEQKQAQKLDYDALMQEAKQLWNELVHPEVDGGDTQMATSILKKLEIIFGRQIKMSEITEDQVDLLNLAILDIRDLKKKM